MLLYYGLSCPMSIGQNDSSTMPFVINFDNSSCFKSITLVCIYIQNTK